MWLYLRKKEKNTYKRLNLIIFNLISNNENETNIKIYKYQLYKR